MRYHQKWYEPNTFSMSRLLHRDWHRFRYETQSVDRQTWNIYEELPLILKINAARSWCEEHVQGLYMYRIGYEWKRFYIFLSDDTDRILFQLSHNIEYDGYGDWYPRKSFQR